MRRLYTWISALCLICLFAAPSLASRQKTQGWCEDGGFTVSVPGGTAPSVNKFQRSYTSCTVTVYLAGTVTLATIYADSSGTAKANPFTAAATGQWFFYADGGNYDVRFSGGGVAAPFTLGDFRVPNEIFDVTDYGAKCDGSTNDFTAIDKARSTAAAQVNGGTVLIPSNVTSSCLTSSNITFGANVSVRIEAGGGIKANSPQTVTFNGGFTAPAQQVFFGTGTFTFGGSHVPAAYSEWWGCIGDAGTTNNTTCLNAAFAQTNVPVYLMPGANYRVNSNLSTPATPSIICPSYRNCTISAGAAVTQVLGLNSAATNLKDFIIDGTLTTSAVGVLAGISGSTWGGRMEGVLIKNFTGAGGIGTQIGDSVGATFYQNMWTGSNINVLVQGASSMAFPTTIHGFSNRIESATTKGMKVASCFGSAWYGTIFESSGQEGLYVNNAVGGDITDCDFYNSWLEANNGNNASNYQLNVVGANSRTTRFRIQDSYFNPTGATKNMNFDASSAGSSIAGMVLDNNQMVSGTSLINVVNSGTIYGIMANWPESLTYATVVSDAGNNFTPVSSTNILPVKVGGTGSSSFTVSCFVVSAASSTGALTANCSPSFTGTITMTTSGLSNVPGFKVVGNDPSLARIDVQNTAGTHTYSIRGGITSVGQGGFSVYDITSSASRMVINDNGTWQMPIYGAGTATFDASGNITSVSDERMKNVSGKFTAGLHELLKVKPITYKWNAASGLETEHRYAGFSAQNMRAAGGSNYADLLTGQNPDGMYTLQDRAILAMLVNAIKELNAEVEQLKKAK